MTFRYGIIGTGMMGLEHMLDIAHIPDATVTAFADPHLPSRNGARIVAPDATEFEDHLALVTSGLCDAVVVATPNHTHADILTDVLSTDLHVLVEKPLCTTVADCRRVVTLADTRTAVTWVGMEYRYMPPVARLIAEVRSGTIGEPRMLAIREHRFPFLSKVGDWNRFNRNTGGTLVEKCCHFFDLMNAVVDRSPVRILASGAQDVNHLEERYQGEAPDVLDNAYVIAEYEGGARAMLDLCMFADATHNQTEVAAVGDRGKLEALLPESTVRIGRRGEHWIGGVEIHHVDDPRIAYRGHHHGSSYLEHLDFIEACTTGQATAVPSEDGLVSVAMGVAAQLSIEERRPILLDEVLA